MKVFCCESHRLHAPAWYVADGSARPCPEVPGRVGAIVGALARHGLVEVATSEAVPAAVSSLHAAEYLDYLRTIHEAWHEEFGTDVLPDTFPRRVVGRPKLAPHARAGQFCFDLAAPITAGTWGAAVDSARVAIAAAQAVIEGERASYALCRPPGHHAGRNYCGGFCYMNNVAAAAERMLMEDDGIPGLQRVAILDVDYHHGNGTQDIFYERGDVLFVSLHADPNTQYPYFWGNADETGAGAGHGCNLNLPLKRGTTSEQWFSALHFALRRIASFAPDALLVSLGVDAHQADGVGDFNLTIEDYGRLGEEIERVGLPTVFVQEGGYNLDAIGPCVAATLDGFESS